MNKCHDSVSRRFACEEERLFCAFTDEVNREYKEKRYGIKSCKNDRDEGYLWDITQLFSYVVQTDLDGFDKNTFRNKMYMEDRLKEMNGNACLPDYRLQNLNICNISSLLETINSVM